MRVIKWPCRFMLSQKAEVANVNEDVDECRPCGRMKRNEGKRITRTDALVLESFSGICGWVVLGVREAVFLCFLTYIPERYIDFFLCLILVKEEATNTLFPLSLHNAMLSEPLDLLQLTWLSVLLRTFSHSIPRRPPPCRKVFHHHHHPTL